LVVRDGRDLRAKETGDTAGLRKDTDVGDLDELPALTGVFLDNVFELLGGGMRAFLAEDARLICPMNGTTLY
jgi:hypothetical protein